MQRSDDPADRVPGSPLPVLPLWFACLAQPIAAIVHLQLSYVLAHTACSTATKILLHVATVGLIILIIAAGLTAARIWKRLGSDPPSQHPGPLGTHRLMALLGMMGSLIFGVFILAQWFPSLVLGPCVRT